MDDEKVTRDEWDDSSNLCGDLVSLRRLEPGMIYLLRDTPPGIWLKVRELYRRAGEETASIKEPLSVAWLPSPGDPDYAVVLFHDDESKWSLTADYNISRLLGQKRHPAVAVAG